MVSKNTSSSGSAGLVHVVGPGSTWTNSGVSGNGGVEIGGSGTGALNIASDGLVTTTNHNFIAREPDSTGTATVSGMGSQWMMSFQNDFHIGHHGEGMLNVTSGGNVTKFAGGDVNIAHSAIGTLKFSGGGTFTARGGQTFLGRTAGADGRVTITGNGSMLELGGFNVDQSGMGTMLLQSGGQVSSTANYIGRQAGSTDEVIVEGIGSTWTQTHDLNVGWSGSGTLTVEGGGTIVIDSTIDQTGFIGRLTGSVGQSRS